MHFKGLNKIIIGATIIICLFGGCAHKERGPAETIGWVMDIALDRVTGGNSPYLFHMMGEVIDEKCTDE